MERDLTITKCLKPLISIRSQEVAESGTFVLDANATSGLSFAYVESNSSVATIAAIL